MSNQSLPLERTVESRSVVLYIGGDSNDLGPNKRLHWQAERRIKSKWRGRAYVAYLMAGGDDLPFFEKARITFTLRRGRSLDPDNAHSSKALKVIVDELKGRLFPDDKAACCCYGPLKQITGSQYRHNPCVEVLVEEITEEGHSLSFRVK
jgi:hypothetical protein